MNEEKQKFFDNFLDLEQDLMDSNYNENLSILREAWGIEIDKPGCSQCIKNAAQNKYSQIAFNLISHDLSIEQAKQINDMRAKLNKEHQEVQDRINSQVEAEIKRLKADSPQELPQSIPKVNPNSNPDSDKAFNPFENQ